VGIHNTREKYSDEQRVFIFNTFEKEVKEKGTESWSKKVPN